MVIPAELSPAAAAVWSWLEYAVATDVFTTAPISPFCAPCVIAVVMAVAIDCIPPVVIALVAPWVIALPMDVIWLSDKPPNCFSP